MQTVKDPGEPPSAAGSAALVGPSAVLEVLRPALEDSFEASLFGLMEPEVFMEVALQLVQLEVDPRAIPEPDPSGAIRFPIVGTPAGMNAQLWVQRATNPKFAEDVLSLRVTLDPSKSPYIAEGASRRAPELEVTVWRDPQGSIKNLGILTDIVPDGQNTQLGLPLDAGEVPFGMHYTMYADDPSKSVARMNGMLDGVVGSLTRQVNLGPDPSMSDVQRLSSGLLALYSKAKE